MRAKYNKAVLAARGIIQETAKEYDLSYEEVYEGFKNTIRCGLASADPDSVAFWHDVKRQAGKEVPSPEDLLISVTTMSRNTHGTSYLRYTRPIFH